MKLIGALIIFALSVLASLFIGVSSNVTIDSEIFKLLRLPRTVLAVAVGGGISIAGLLAQASLSNPLADPFTLGIASAAALGAIIGSVLFKGTFFLVPIFSFIFAIVTLLFLYLWLKDRFHSSTDILLSGVILGLFCSSLATFFQAITEPSTWNLNLGWLLGSLSLRTLEESLITLTVVLVLTILVYVHSKILDLISQSETLAVTSGVDIKKYRLRFFLILSVLTALCVSSAGIIGFLGFLTPHLVRRLNVRTAKQLVPMTFLLGASLLLFSDVLSRTLITGTEVPVGVLTALLGAPGFLILFQKESRHG